jgi:hypothetical protein
MLTFKLFFINLLIVDICDGMMRAISHSTDKIEIGRYNDIDELFRVLFTFFPPAVADSIGIKLCQAVENSRLGWFD